MPLDRVRVLVGLRPRILDDLLKKVIERQPDMEVVGEFLDPVDLLLKVRELDANIVLLNLPDSDEDPGICSHLLEEYPSLWIIAVSPARDVAYLYRKVEAKETIPGASESEIIAAIRRFEIGATH